MRTTALLTGASLALVAAAAVTPAVAGPAKPKPVSKSYTATAPLPGVTNFGLGVCEGSVPQSTFDETFKAPFTGRLTVHQDGFVGDWDMALQQDGANAAESAQDIAEPIDRPEDVAGFKLKKGEEITIRSCNFSGGPTANVKYTFVAS